MAPTLPGSAERVPLHTDPKVNDEIGERTLDNVARYWASSPEERREYLRRLDSEWDTERYVAAIDGATLLAVGVLGLLLPRRWMFAVPALVGGFLLQHALQGWCALMPVLRRNGVRTPYEIEGEKAALGR